MYQINDDKPGRRRARALPELKRRDSPWDVWEYQVYLARAAQYMTLVQGYKVREVAEILGVSRHRLKRWWHRMPRYQARLAKRQAGDALRWKRHRVTTLERRERKARRLRRVKDCLGSGMTLDETCETTGYRREDILRWLHEAPAEALIHEALGPAPVKQPLVEPPVVPSAVNDQVLAVWQQEWGQMRRQAASLTDRNVVERARALRGSTSLTQAQWQRLKSAVVLESMAGELLTRVETLRNYELAGVAGATQALYYWQHRLLQVDKQYNAALKAAGVLVDGAPAEVEGETKTPRWQLRVPDG